MNLEKLTDEELMASAQNGQKEKCFEIIYKRNIGVALRFLEKFEEDEEERKNLVQESFVKVYNNINKYKPSGKFNSWFLTILKNHAITEFRKKEHQKKLLGNKISIERDYYNENHNLDKNPVQNNVEEIYIKKEESNYIQKLVNLLPEKYSFFIKSRYFNEFSYKEISKISGIDVNLVKTRLFHARKELKKILKENGFRKLYKTENHF